MSTLNVTFFGKSAAAHVLQLFQQTTGKVTSALTTTLRFVKPEFVTVHGEPAMRDS
jgi:hypothetical protein